MKDHGPTHTWEWRYPTEDPNDPDAKFFKEASQSGDLRCTECDVVIPGQEYFAVVDNNRRYLGMLSVEEHYRRMSEQVELLALKYEKELGEPRNETEG